MKLVGKGTYRLTSKPSFYYAVTEVRTAEVETLAEYYYDILREEKIEIYDDYGESFFVGVIDYIDYNFEQGIMKIYMTEYIGILKYKYDLLGVAEVTPYVVVYTDSNPLYIGNQIFDGTEFTMSNVSPLTLTLEGSYLDRFAWLKLLNSNVICGLDSDGNYTTVTSDIVSGERSTDIIVNYDTGYVECGVRGCYKPNAFYKYVWKQKTINLDAYINEINQYKDKVFKYKRVIVVGKDDVIGSAYLDTVTDVPVLVITDDSCIDESSCEIRAKTELALNNSISSITLSVSSEIFYDRSLEEGMLATITEPINIAGEYTINQISVNGDDVEVTLGSPKQTLIKSMYDLEKRVNILERWR